LFYILPYCNIPCTSPSECAWWYTSNEVTDGWIIRADYLYICSLLSGGKNVLWEGLLIEMSNVDLVLLDVLLSDSTLLVGVSLDGLDLLDRLAF
jgi:hypothetical protein